MGKFQKPLDQWITEETEVTVNEPVLDRAHQVVGVKQSTRKIPQKVRYTQMSAPTIIDCGKGRHFWYIPDRHVHTAHCKNCKKLRFIRAVYEYIDADGHLINRDTNTLLD